MMSSIDEIKKRYEYKIDPFDFVDDAGIKFCYLFGTFVGDFEEYKFDEKIKEIKRNIDNKRNKIEKNILESFEKSLKEISDGSEKILKKVKDNFSEICPMLSMIAYDYKHHQNKPGAKDIYLKVSRDIIDKEVNMYIKYHKILILYNDKISDIKKNLSN